MGGIKRDRAEFFPVSHYRFLGEDFVQRNFALYYID